MAEVTIYHNPGCSKSRGAIEIAEAQKVDFEVIEYLQKLPTKAELESIVSKLEDPISELVRKDKKFAELGLNEADYTTPETVISILLEHPVLMQRPIIIKGSKAIIARPSERIHEIIG